MDHNQKTLIRGASIVSMDPSIGDIPKGDILLVGDKIAAVGSRLEVTAESVVEASGMIASPGFVDTHRHIWQTTLKGVARDWSLFDYTCMMRTMFSVCYEPEDAQIANYVGALEAVNAGITSIVDHSHLQLSPDHSDALVRGLKDSGIGGIFCYGVYRNPKFKPGDDIIPAEVLAEIAGPLEDWHRDNAQRVREQHFPSNDSRLKFGIASSEFEVFSSIEPIAAELAWSRTLEPKRISIHIGVGVNSEFRVIPLMKDAGILGDDLLFIHGAALSNSDLDMLHVHGGWLATTPETELQMGMGYPVLERVIASGGTPSLGIDIVSNFAGDMFAQMRLMLQTMRFRDFEQSNKGIPTSPRFPARKMLEYATLGGARAIGAENEIGTLTPGKKADIVLTRMDAINMCPVVDPVAALMFYATINDVDSVWIDGIARKRDGRLTDVNWPMIEKNLRDSRDRIFERYQRIPEKQLRNAWAPLWGLEAGAGV